MSTDLATKKLWDSIEAEYIREVTLSNSDKTITVPSDEEWKILGIYITYVATATVGNRMVLIQFRDSTVHVHWQSLCPNIAASETARIRLDPGGVRGTEAIGGVINWTDCLPAETILPPNHSIRVYDAAAIDPAADDMEIFIVLKKRKI